MSRIVVKEKETHTRGKMSESVKCPLCGREFRSEPLKKWNFRFYEVKRFECSNCKAKFNIYESPKFTIPKTKH